MRLIRIQKILLVIGLFLAVTVGVQAQATFPTFTKVTPSGTPQIFRGNAVWGDYNNDGLLDVIAVGRDISDGWKPNVFLLKNTGSSFEKITKLDIPSENVYNAVFAWIDYNNDGNLDLLYMGTANGDEQSDDSNNVFFRLYENRGQVHKYAFKEVENTGLKGLYVEQENQYAGAIAVGDYNNDGYPDVLVTGSRDGDRYVSLYKNNEGDGSFTLQEEVVTGSFIKSFDAVSSGGVVLADLNNDGYLDIISNGWSNSVNSGYSAMYVNNQDGTFTKTNWTDKISKSGQTKAGQTIVGDLNNNGFLDIVTTGERTDEDNWSDNANLYHYQSMDGKNIKYTETLGSAAGVLKMKKGSGEMADFNSDGLMDMIWAGESPVFGGNTSIYLNKGNGQFDRKLSEITAARGGAVVALADFDNDGYLDALVMGYGNSSVFDIWRNNANLVKNTKPSAPTNLKSSYSGGKLTFTWDAGTDLETPEGGLRYNLYLKKADGEIVMVIPANKETGFLKISELSGAINTTSYTLAIPRGDYEWGVQTIDQGRLASAFAVESSTVNENDITISNGGWDIVLSGDDHTIEYIHKGNTILTGAYVRAKNNNEYLKSSDYPGVDVSNENVTDKFGSGKKYIIKYSGLANKPDIEQVFYFYSDKEYFLTEASLISSTSISTNYIAPIYTTTRSSFLSQDVNNRVLTVPFDNDGFVRYGSYPMTQDSVSFEVTALFNGVDRNGLVIGSVEHDTWKTGVRFSTKDNKYIDKIECYGGITHKLTRDVSDKTQTQHGKISGNSLKSPKILFGYFDDWRRGMEQFGEANAIVAPPRKWEKGTPFGWNSWSGMETNVNYEGVLDISNFISKDLKAKSFDSDCVYIGLDSWWNENFTDEQLRDFVSHCKANGQEAGIYHTPFSDWWNEEAAGDRYMEGTNNQYKYKDAYLYSNGKIISIESRALDPTHPGTKMMLKARIDQFKALGFKYIKLDFINNGTLEADSFYEDGITTGVQAYNHGMQYLVDLCGEDMFLALSIAPSFPAQYGHSKRISCDTWGEMNQDGGNTGYMLNSLSFGWWLDRVYPFNDADHLVLHDRESKKSYGDGANRARITSGVITGIYMLGDNLSINGSYPGSKAIRDKNIEMVTNKDINEIAHYGKSFYPVDGHKAVAPDRSENYFMMDVDQYIYLAVFNFEDSKDMNEKINISKLGVSAGAIKGIKELWMNKELDLEGDELSITVPKKDVRVYRFEKEGEELSKPEIIEEPEDKEAFVGETATFSVQTSGGYITYQWFKDGVVVPNGTSRLLTIKNVDLNGAGKYKCVATNKEGSATSAEATLKVYTADVAIDHLLINNEDEYGVNDTYVMDCGTSNNISVEIVLMDASAKVIYEGKEAVNNTISFSVAKPGKKNLVFSVESALQANMAKTYSFEVEKYFDFDQIVAVRWNNTMIANNNNSTNGGYKFSSYRWFKDDVLVGNMPSYSAGPRKNMILNKDAKYHLEVTTTGGDVLRTCATNIALQGTDIKVYPSRVSANEAINVELDTDEEIAKDAVIEIFNMSGFSVKSKKMEGRLTTITAPTTPGIYLLTTKSKGFVEKFKIIVQ